jgi:hypothetical protein
MALKLKREELIQIVENVTHPKGRGFTSEQINQQLLLFCINCPDPVFAMDLMIECIDPMSPAELVDRALACPPRDATTLPESELPLTHPLRHMKLEF